MEIERKGNKRGCVKWIIFATYAVQNHLLAKYFDPGTVIMIFLLCATNTIFRKK